MSKTFKIKSGLRQGDALSPIIFHLALEKGIRKVWEDGQKWKCMGNAERKKYWRTQMTL
jgi:hypothetical protein